MRGVQSEGLFVSWDSQGQTLGVIFRHRQTVRLVTAGYLALGHQTLLRGVVADKRLTAGSLCIGV